MKYFLDTDCCIYIITGREPYGPRVLDRLERLGSDDSVLLSAVTLSELVHGSTRSRWKRANLALLDQFLLDFEVLPFDEAAARRSGTVRSSLESKGRPIGPYDVMIAGHALSVGAAVVTHNVREFSRVTGLRVADWAAD